MGLRVEIDKMKFDKRLIEWALRTNQITKEELKKHLEALPDLESNTEPFDLEESSDD